VLWLLYTSSIVNLRLLKDRNFALGCGMMGCMPLMMYASSVISRRWRNWCWAIMRLGRAGVVAGALIMIMFIPVVGKLMGMVQAVPGDGGFATLEPRCLPQPLAARRGFFHLGRGPHAPDLGLAFLFVPISPCLHHLPKEQNSDGARSIPCSAMWRRSIGISIVRLVSNSQQDICSICRSI